MSVALVERACSNRPHASTASGRGNQWWKREVHHAVDGNKTLCGIDATEWLRMASNSPEQAIADPSLCNRCRAALSNHGEKQ